MAWIIFDMDDTLLMTSGIYLRTYERFVDEMARRGNPLTSEETIDKLLEIDWKNRATHGVSKDRLALSMYETYVAIALQSGQPVEPDSRATFDDIMARVHNHRYRMVWGARNVLTELKRRGHRLVLYTRGDVEMQQRKIREANLAPYFEHIYVLQSKGVAELSAILNECSIEPRDAWIIGDELMADIVPGLELGMSAIQVYGYCEARPEAMRHSKPYHRVPSLVRILPILSGGGGQ